MLKKSNIRLFLRFEILGRLLWAAFLLPVLYGILTLAMHLTGYTYLTGENFRRFVLHPLTLGLFLIAGLYIAMITVIDICAMLAIFSDRCEDCGAALLYGITRAWKLVTGRKTWRLLPTALLSVLIGESGLLIVTAQHFSVGGFILNWIWKRSLFPLVFLGILILAVLFFRRLLVFHYCVLDGDTFSEARKKGILKSRGHRIWQIIYILAVQAGYYLFYFLSSAAGILLIIGIGFLLRKAGWYYTVPTFALVTALSVYSIFVISLGTPVLYVSISQIYEFLETGSRGRELPLEAHREQMTEKEVRGLRFRQAGVGILAVSCVTLYVIFIIQAYRGRFNLPIEHVHTLEVTAHRGASRDCPENTMAAFRTAAEQGADWIELDIQQSKDQQLFVMHDRNFRRTTGVNKFAWELDYDEIRLLDAGSWFRRDFEGERIPLLSEAIDFAIEADIRLNIELKPTGNETDFEKQLVDLLHEKDFTDRCVVTSQIYDSIRKVKELDESIETVYVMGFAYGPINRLTAADHFSINARSITDAMVRRIHNSGHQVYAWTINQRHRVKDMMEMHVDNVITDRVIMAKNCVSEEIPGTWVQDFTRFLNRVLAMR